MKSTWTTAESGWRCDQTPRVQFSRPRTQASEPPLTGSLAAKRRAEALHVALFLTQPSEPSTMTDRCLLRTLVRNVATKEARWVHCFSWSLGPSPRRPITAACPRRGAATAFVHRRCIRNSTHRSLFELLLFAPRTAAVYPRLCAGRYLIRDRCHFSI